jgi:L-aminopeptidase/D-esterase-like protein
MPETPAPKKVFLEKPSRRRFLHVAGGAALATCVADLFASPTVRATEGKGSLAMPAPGSLTDIAGIRVGHFTDARRPTGCTVILFDTPATAGADVRGGAPGTREIDLLAPTNLVQRIDALVLSGGSAFGLDAASGVVKFLEERNIGFDVGVTRVPIVPAAILFDLTVGDPKIHPDADAGRKACEAATAKNVAEGAVGAGAGATVGKLLGFTGAMKGGVGMASLILKDGLRVAALVVVNAVGDVRDPRTGKIVAGARTPDGKSFADPSKQLRDGTFVSPFPVRAGTNTTIGVVATNAPLNKTELAKVAQMAHDGLARTIYPVHTPFDGDTLFAVAVPEVGAKEKPPADVGRIGALAAEATADAVLRAVLTAKGLPGLPSATEFQPS